MSETKPCVYCGGTGKKVGTVDRGETWVRTCRDCGGTGKVLVPIVAPSRLEDVFALMDKSPGAITDWMARDIKARLVAAMPRIQADALRNAAMMCDTYDGTDAWLVLLADAIEDDTK